MNAPANETQLSRLTELRQANHVDPANRKVQNLLVDALLEFAKIVVESEPEHARNLLHEAAEISPLNLRLESIRNLVADRLHPISMEENLTFSRAVEQSVAVSPVEVSTNTRWSNIWIQVQDGWKSARGQITRSRIAYSVAALAACLVLVFAAARIGRSKESKPELTKIGTGTLLQSATLFRSSAEDSGAAGNLKTGQQVELLQQIPETTLDAWTRIRAVDDPGMSGYVRLLNLGTVQTNDRQFDLWVAASQLDRSSSSELRNRLEDVEQKLRAEPPPPSRNADQTFLRVSKAFARLASESSKNPAESERTQLALANSEAYLKRIEGALQFSDDAELLQNSIPRMRAALDLSTAAKKPGNARARRVGEETRIMRLAKSAFSKGSYEDAIQYCTQVLKINGRNAEARKLQDRARRAQKDLKTKIVRQ
jgi:hypothetical protein